MVTINNSYAVIIGINKYAEPSWELKTAVNDARTLTKLFRDIYEYEVLELLDEQAIHKTLDHLLTAFENQTIPLREGDRKVEPHDRVLFYFAGHGIAIKGDEKDDGPQGFIYPQDVIRGDKSNSKLLPMRRLHDALVKLGCHHLLIILDCCFAGSFRWVVRQAELSEEEMYLERYNRYFTGCAQEVITSSAYNETAADFLSGSEERGENDQHSPFASTLLEALNPKNNKNADSNKDGVITTTDIIQYIEDKFLDLKAGQTPGYCQLKKHDFGKYIFIIPGFDADSRLKKAPLPDEADPRYPYKGLLSFEREDKDKFFGRTRLIKKLTLKVKEEPITIVLGASGSGKSSLVKAGLIPVFENSIHQHEFEILRPIRPGESPITALARVCNDIDNSIEKSVFASRETSGKTVFFRKELNKNNDYFANKVGDWSLVHVDRKLLLVIDQFEELVTLCRDENEQRLFLKQLVKAIENYREQLRIVITLRSDYEPVLRALLESEFQGKVRTCLVRGRLDMSPMTREELREAIVEPAEKIALFFEGKTEESDSFLVDRLIDDVINMPGGLSLLSFTLSELYRKFCQNVHECEQYNRVITHRDYEELGKVIGSLTKKSDEIYDKLVKKDAEYSKIIKHMMLRMVAEGSADLARRRVFMKELKYPKLVQEKVDEVIKEFTEARLFVKGQDEKENEYVEPAHDALVRGWSRLREWLQPKQEKQKNLIENIITIQRQLTAAAEEWDGQRPEKFHWKTHPRNWLKYLRQRYKQGNFLWDDNPYLDIFKGVLDSPDSWYNQLETEFVKRSIQSRRNNYLLKKGFILSVLTIISGFAFVQWCESRNSQTGRLAASSEVSFNSNKQLEALIDGLKAGKYLQMPIGIQPETRSQAMSALQQAVYWVRERNNWLGHDGTIRNVSFSPNGEIIASVSEDKTIKLWNLEGKKLNTLEKHEGIVNSVSFSPNGQMLASASYDGTIKLWSINGKLLDDKRGEHKAVVYSVSFSPDGKMLASASWDCTVKLWSLKNGKLKLLKTVELPQEILEAIKKDKNQHTGSDSPKPYSFHGVSFSPDGKLIAAGNEDTKVRIWNREGKLLTTLSGHRDRVYSISFSPDSKILASSSADSTIRLWDVQKGKRSKPLTGHKSDVYSTSFSADGKTLISGSNDNSIKFWGVEDGKELKTLAGYHAVRSVNTSPDGKILASAGIDSNITLWGINGEDVIPLIGHSQQLYSVSFSPDSKIVATGGSDSTSTKNGKLYRIKLWRRLDGKELKLLSGHKSPVTAISFSSQDGQILASGDTEGKIILWNPKNGKELKTLKKAHLAKVDNLSFSPDGKILASGGATGTIELWDRKGNLLAIFPKQKQQKEILSISFSPDSKLIASGSTTGTIELWNVEKRQLINKPLEGKCGPVRSVSFSSDGNILASGSEGKCVKIWSIPDGKNLYTRIKHREGVNSVSFLPNSHILASASDDKTIKLWDAKKGTEITTLKGHTNPVYSVSFSPDGKTLASASGDSTALLWNTELLDLNTALARGCKLVNSSWNLNFVQAVQDICAHVATKVKISSGDKILAPTGYNSEKVNGANNGKFEQATKDLHKYLNQHPNDPEA